MRDIRFIVGQAVNEPEYYPQPRDEYKRYSGLNPSSLAAGLMGTTDVNPGAVKLAWESPDRERTQASQDSLDCGTLAHLAVLQPELIADDVAVWKGDRRAGAEWDRFEDENVGNLIVRHRDYTRVMQAVNVMRSLPEVASKLVGIQAEVAMFVSESANGLVLECKGQVDAVNVAKRVIVDLKTTEAGIDQRSCEQTIRRFHYREKMALYRRWMAMCTATHADEWKCYNVFMSLTPPYGVRVIKFTSAALEWGEYRMQSAIDAVAECLVADEFPVYCRESVMSVEMYESDDENGEPIDYGS